MLITGAAAGLGIALVPEFFVAEQREQQAYPAEFTHGKLLASFRTWLVEQASDYTALRP